MKSTKVSMRNPSLAICLLMSGCSLALSPDKKQCVADDDCGQHNGKPIYQCVENYCEQVSCNDDSACRSRGDFICESNVCENAQCSRDQDCKDGEMCTEGRCTDPRDVEDEAIFGCFDVKQPLTSSQPGSLQLNLYSYGESGPVKDLKVTVCKPADLACNTPVPTTFTYDEKGTLIIKGLENGDRYNVRFSAKDGAGNPYLEHEYYMQRPIVGATVEADKLEMVPQLLVEFVADSAGLKFDPTKGLVLTQTFGCDLKPLAGVSVTDSLMAVPFYLAAGLPNADATETDSAGVAGFLNMEARTTGALQHRLTFSYAGDTMFSYTVAPRPNVVTFVQVYMGDFNTTIDRAETRPTRRE